MAIGVRDISWSSYHHRPVAADEQRLSLYGRNKFELVMNSNECGRTSATQYQAVPSINWDFFRKSVSQLEDQKLTTSISESPAQQRSYLWNKHPSPWYVRGSANRSLILCPVESSLKYRYWMDSLNIRHLPAIIKFLFLSVLSPDMSREHRLIPVPRGASFSVPFGRRSRIEEYGSMCTRLEWSFFEE